MERLLAAVETPRERAIPEVLYAAGCRISELCSIRLENMNFEDARGGTAKITGKGGKERLLLLHRTALKAIKKYLQGRTIGFLFIADGMPPQRGSVVWVERNQRWVACVPATQSQAGTQATQILHRTGYGTTACRCRDSPRESYSRSALCSRLSYFGTMFNSFGEHEL